jgi:hypothetical protein
MVKDMTPREEQRGTSAVFIGGSAVAIAAGIALLVWFFVPGFSSSNLPNQAANGPRSSQSQGVSVAAQNKEPLPTTSPRSNAPDVVGRKEELTGSAVSDLNMTPDQVNVIRTYAAQHADQRLSSVNYTMTVGAQVPESAKLYDMPAQLGDALPSFKNDQYVLVGNQFIIVEKNTHRIVAIVPVPA